jgi:DNA-binding XRE family transcriptional regulator
VTSGAVGRELKRLRRLLGVTQAVSARAIGVSRANLTQWETGKYLPSEQNARQLDDYFSAGNALVSLIERARSGQGAGPGPIADANFVPGQGSLRHVFQHVGRTLADNLIRDDQGKPIGWPHNLRHSNEATSLSTAYGIKTMLLVGEPYVDFGALEQHLLAIRSNNGWLGRSGTLRAERNAMVLDALLRIGTSLGVDEALTICAHSLDQFSRTRPYLLSALLQTVVRLRPDAPLVAELTDALLATRLNFDGLALWPENSQPGLVLPEASAPHTARAVVALQDVLRCSGERADIRDAVGQATRWLADRIHPDDLLGEELIRPKSDSTETSRVFIRHFTPAWVVQALAVAPEVPVHQLHRAMGALWERYDPKLGLWAWPNGSLPIWMTHDALTALASATLTLVQPPLSPPEDKG